MVFSLAKFSFNDCFFLEEFWVILRQSEKGSRMNWILLARQKRISFLHLIINEYTTRVANARNLVLILYQPSISSPRPNCIGRNTVGFFTMSFWDYQCSSELPTTHQIVPCSVWKPHLAYSPSPFTLFCRGVTCAPIST